MTVFSEDAVRILRRRYFLIDEDGRIIEDEMGMLRRVAQVVASVEKERHLWEERFFSLMAGKRFLPNSPTLANAGRAKGQMAACFVLPVPDSIKGIFEAMKSAAQIHKSGGGTGFSFSQIRPKGDSVFFTGGVASGPVPFIKAFNCATDAVKQGGMRQGANMAVLDYWHPDILDFIRTKEKEGALTNFNISVGVDQKFMSQAASGGYIEMINPRTGKEYGKSIKAMEIFDLLVAAAWENGEPGILFFDHINNANSLPGYGPIHATNPCGEQPLFDYESCNLGSLNLNAYLIESSGGVGKQINWDLLANDVHTAIRFLDNVIDVNYYVFPEIETVTKGNRKIGLGVMGFANLLIALDIPYASRQSLKLIDDLMGFIKAQARAASKHLGKEKGSFSNIGSSIFKGIFMRNATVTTIAPTGTLSMLVEASSGIEPLFGLSFVKEVLEGQEFVVTNKQFEEVARRRGFWSKGMSDEVADRGSLMKINGVPEDVKKVFATAFEVTPEWHVKVQAAFQRHIDNAVSKTINFPAEAIPEDVRTAYLLAWKLGCKGLTIYRSGSRENQVLKFTKKDHVAQKYEAGCTNCTN